MAVSVSKKLSISYSTNWMGPVSTNWYKDRGFIKDGEPFHSDMFNKMIYPTDITEHYSIGRIDVRGTDNPYGDELGLPMMRSEDWNRFGDWLSGFRTETMWKLNQLVEEYEKTNPKIRWWDEDAFQKRK